MAEPASPGQLLLQYLQNPFSNQLQSTSIYVAFGTSIGTMVVIGLIFSIIRPYHTVVYAPKIKHADKKHQPPPIGKGVFAWFDPLIKTKELEQVEKIGMDGTIFLRFTRMLRNIFIFLSIFGCAILIPVHIRSSDVLSATDSTNVWRLMTPQNVTGFPMWSHVAFTYISDVVVLYFLWTNSKAVTRLRRMYFQSPEYQMSLHARSILLTHIPPSDRTDEGILRIADLFERTSSLPRPVIARNVKELPDLIKEHDASVRKLESVLAKYLKNPDALPAMRPTTHGKNRAKVDAIDYLTGRIQQLEVRIKDVRESIDKRNPMSYGFVTYDRIEDAHSVAYAATKKSSRGVGLRLAPKPNDLIWDNLPLSKSARGGKRFMSNVWVALLTVVWIVPNALIAIFLVNLANLAAIWPWFSGSFHSYETAKYWAIVQAIAAPAITSLFYLYLPNIFRRISTKAGDLTKTSRERHVTHKLYAFFVFNNLIVFSIFSALWGFVGGIIHTVGNNPGKDVWQTMKDEHLARSLLTTMCNNSPFWITWLLQRNLGAAVDLAQVVNLVWIWFARTFTAPTPRQIIELTAPPTFDYASYYNYFLFYATVAMCYSAFQPIVLLITLLYFVVDCWLKKYLLLYVFVTKNESGGQFWNMLFNRVLFSTLLQNFVGALVILGAGPHDSGTWSRLACLVPLPFILWGFKYYCMRKFEDQTKYYSTAAGLPDPEHLIGSKKGRNERLGVKFGNPALYKPLITPMVHAKAQHVLASIYRGRINSEDGPKDYSDIALERMAPDAPGRTATGVPDMFEVVQESDLDFANYKNRADFRDEHGGDGELYGRPTDLMTERSQTPASFMTDGSASAHDTRVGTPEPMPPLPRPPGQTDADPEFVRDSFGDLGQRPPYHAWSDSDRGTLVRQAHPMGYAPVGSGRSSSQEEPSDRQPYSLETWHQGYVGVPGGDQDIGMSYEAYRPHR